jgi:RND family efflux transporter MFP subunit
VKIVKPVRKTLSHKIEQPGEIQAFARTPIRARISGYVLSVAKDIGDPVAKDDVLAELSVPEMDEELNQKKALVKQAEARLEQARKLADAAAAHLESAKAKVKEAEASRLRAAAERLRAESQYERMKKSSSVISRDAIDETRLGAEAARAAVAEVEAKVKSAEAAQRESAAKLATAKADIGVAEANLRVARAAEGRVAALVGYATLKAPFAGVVTRRHIDEGHLLHPSEGNDKGEPVFVVAQTDPVRIFVDVPENDAVLITDGARAVVRVQALKGQEFSGTVTRSAWSLDPRSRTLRTEIDLPNPNVRDAAGRLQPGRLRPGMYAYATITVERANVLAVPASAVVTQGDHSFCYRLEGDKAVRTPIQVGFRDGDRIEVVKKTVGKEGGWVDFTGEEEVIVNAAGLSDGQAVSIPAGSSGR